MESRQRAAKLAVVVIVATATFAAGETRKEYRFTVNPRASVSVNNQYGSISVRPGHSNEVVVTAVLHSNKVAVDHDQNGNRVDILSRLLPGASPDSGRVDYDVLVPADTSLSLHSTTGTLHVEKLRGDVILEGPNASVDVRDISDAHVHVKTLNGPVTLTNIQDGHVEITSVSGDVTLNSVSGPLVQVNSTSGTIRYDGDFGAGGRYQLRSHSGDINATAPSSASMELDARSVKGGPVDSDFPLRPKSDIAVAAAGKVSALVGTAGKAASKVVLHTFSGKIHFKKR